MEGVGVGIFRDGLRRTAQRSQGGALAPGGDRHARLDPAGVLLPDQEDQGAARTSGGGDIASLVSQAKEASAMTEPPKRVISDCSLEQSHHENLKNQMLSGHYANVER